METTVLNKQQLKSCYEEANKIAKELIEKDVSKLFGKGNNAIFCLEVDAIFTAGIISIISKKLNLDTETIFDAFFSRVEEIIERHKQSHLTIIK